MTSLVTNSLSSAEKESYDVSVDSLLIKSVQWAFLNSGHRPVYNAFFAEPQRHVTVGRSIHLWERQWTRSFVDHLLRLSQEGVDLPETARLSSELISHWWPDAVLQDWACHIPAARLERSGSVLDVFMRNPKAALMEFMAHEALLDLSANRVAAAGDLVDRATHARFVARAADHHWLADATAEGKGFAADLRAAIGSLGYLLDGINYKGQAIDRIRSIYLGDKAGLKGIDIGGAFGALALEMRLDGGFAAFDVADIKPQNAGLFLWLMDQLGFSGGSRFYFGKGEEHTFDQRYDLICEFGAMLYFARDRLPGFLDRAWEALNPGGVIVVHENIRRPDWRQQEFMFTAPELDSLLSRFGKVDRYDVFSDKLLSAAETGDRAVFRVVQKSA